MDKDHSMKNADENPTTSNTTWLEKESQEDENLIDKAFDEIACQEVIYANQGYSDGLITGHAKQCREGHVLGLKKGFELGSEIGEYRGFALVSLKYLTTEDRANELTPKQKKCVKVLEKIIKSTEEVPSTNLHPNNEIDLEDKSLDVSELLRDIRAKYTLAKNLLSIDDAVDQGDGKTLTTKIVDAPKSKTLSW
jgi:hypothetical protein